jgi:DnaK suppressor protein
MKNNEDEIGHRFIQTVNTRNYTREFIELKDLKKIAGYTEDHWYEFKQLVLVKLGEIKKEYSLLVAALSRQNDDADETGATFKLSDDAADVLSKEQIAQLAIRQQKYIEYLKRILMRIDHKTYNICRTSAKSITPEEHRNGHFDLLIFNNPELTRLN